MNRFYFVAVVLVLGVLVLGMVFAAAQPLVFIDIPGLVMVVVPTLVLCLATFPPRVIGRSFTVAFIRQPASEPELRQAAVFFRSMERYLLLSGLIGAIIGIVTMLTLLLDVAKFGQGLAILLLTVFYAVLLMLVLAIPFRTAVERRLAEKG